MTTCAICGGTARTLNERGVHNICEARRKVGVPITRYDTCPTCEGRGHTGTVKAGPMLSFDLGPAAIRRSIEAVFPRCRTCNGSGAVESAVEWRA